jgi:hypothetical protein
MSIPIRLDNYLVHEAEIEGVVQKRTAPKQIEYWAEVGKAVAQFIPSNDLLALVQGFVEVEVKVNKLPSVTVSSSKVFDILEHDRENKSLNNKVTRASIWYEASVSQQGLLDRVQADGTREKGHFQNGKFLASL